MPTNSIYTYTLCGSPLTIGYDSDDIKLFSADKNTDEYQPERIIFNNPATIVFWKDGTKTVVKCESKTEFNPYYGFCAALTKKVIGNNSKINRLVKNAISEQEKEKKAK